MSHFIHTGDKNMNFFNQHLKDARETYFQHLGHAFRFSVKMAFGSLGCLLHAIFPFLFVKTGSHLIAELHDEMVVNRDKLTPRKAESVMSQNVNA